MLREELKSRIVGLSEAQLNELCAHFDLLCKWNAKLNLTRVLGPSEAAERHYGEAACLAGHLPTGALRIADIGSGGGFPGIPLAILRPECCVTLVESNRRKAVFLKEAARSLKNVMVLAQRAEDIRSSYDWVVSRAVSWEDLKPFVFRLAPRVALLSGQLNIPGSIQFPMEGSDRRFVTIVSRET